MTTPQTEDSGFEAALESALPIDTTGASGASVGPRLAIAPAYEDRDTGAVWVNRGLELQIAPWAVEEHIGPPKTTAMLGDVASWVEYVRRYSMTQPPLLTWNQKGLTAILDYHLSVDAPGRCDWKAFHPFKRSRVWLAWMELTRGPLPQSVAVEKLDDRHADIVDPTPADLMKILRNLRGTINTVQTVELRPDGTSHIVSDQDKVVKGVDQAMDLPADITIRIPVLHGHVDDLGNPVLYELKVKVRVSLEKDKGLQFRLSIPDADKVLEECVVERAAAAKTLLGDHDTLLRADEAGD